MGHADAMEQVLVREGVLERHFPYVKRGPSREWIIPAGRLSEFFQKCLELSDKEDHLEHLRHYREQGVRVSPSDIDD